MDNLLKTFLDLIFPPKCVGCKKFGTVICPTCRENIEIDAFKKCIVCQKPTIKGFTHTSCINLYTPERLIALYSYKGSVKNFILRGKFGPKFFYLFDYLIDLSLPVLIEFGISFGCNALIIPMPLHKERLTYRGFNQSELIADALSKKLVLPVNKKALVRSKKGLVQAHLTKIDRKKNVESAFEVRTSIKGRDIILVDDVCTTGATFLSAAKALKAAGARFVWCFALAKA